MFHYAPLPEPASARLVRHWALWPLVRVAAGVGRAVLVGPVPFAEEGPAIGTCADGVAAVLLLSARTHRLLARI
jgi:hypothetical protein